MCVCVFCGGRGGGWERDGNDNNNDIIVLNITRFILYRGGCSKVA